MAGPVPGTPAFHLGELTACWLGEGCAFHPAELLNWDHVPGTGGAACTHARAHVDTCVHTRARTARGPMPFLAPLPTPPQPPPHSALTSPVNASMCGPGGGQGGKRGQARQGRPGMGSLPSPTQKRRGRHEHRLGAALAWQSASGYLVSRSGLVFPGHLLPKGPLEAASVGALLGLRSPPALGSVGKEGPQ